MWPHREHLRSVIFSGDKHQVGFIYLLQAGGAVHWRDWRGPVSTSWRQSRSVWDPASSSAALPKSGETHVIREAAEGPVISSHLFCVAHSPLYPSCMVDIIFSSSFLGDMGDHSKSK